MPPGALRRRPNCGAGRAPIKPYRFRICGVLPPNSLTKLGVQGGCVSFRGIVMSQRSTKFLSVLVAGMLAGANLTAVAQNGPSPAEAKTADTGPADNCLPGPKGAVPAGSHWYYRLDRATKRKCWYVRAESARTARAAPAQRDAPLSAAPAQVVAPPPPQQQGMSPAVANARAELLSAQANRAQAPSSSIFDTGQRATAPQADPQPSPVSSRWPDSSNASASSDSKLAAADAAPSAQADAAPAPQPAAPALAAPPADSNLDRQASSTQMLLVVMIAALALAGLIAGIVFRFGRKSPPPYDIRNEWRAPWDPLPAEQRASPPIFANHEVPMRRPQAPPPRRPVRTQPAPEVAHEEPASTITEQQIAAMLAQLARSAKT